MDDISPPNKKLPIKPKPTLVEGDIEPTFKEPEQIAHEETVLAKSDEPVKITSKKKRFWPNFKNWSKKKKLLVIALLILILGGGSVAAYWFIVRPQPAVVETVVEQAEPAPEPPKTEASRLSGVQISPELNQRSITGIMIENSLDARPQSGLLDAGVVFEAIAEGGITRFLALFQEGQPGYIGPVRSARPYYIDWVSGFNAAYVHAGGSPEALSLIKSLGIKDIEHGVNGSAFERVNSRFAPHNLYTRTANLDQVKQNRGYNSSTFTSLVRKAEAPGLTPTASSIDLNVSSINFKVHYDYNATTNSYLRVLAGKAHTDEKSGQQLNPKVVVALVVAYKIHADRVHSQYTTIGSGKALIFQDGIVYDTTWHKDSRAGQITFTDAAGAPVGLNPGQTWFTVIATADKATYSPPVPAVTP